MKKPLFTLFVWSVLAVGFAFGHGSMLQPLSRVYHIFLEGPENPQLPSSKAAVQVAGTQAFYDWHEVNLLTPDRNYQERIPDGQLPGVGRGKYAGLNLTRTDWPATQVAPGPYQCVFDAATPHDPSTFTAYITKEGYDPSQPLRWDDLELLPGAENAYLDGNFYKFGVNFPERTGRHVLYVIWQRIDPAGESFYSTSDLIFTPDAVNPPVEENPMAGAEPVDLEATDYQLVATSDWGSGFVGRLTVRNTTGAPLNGWTLSFRLDREIVNNWDSRFVSRQGDCYTLTNETWNGQVAENGTFTIGFEAHGGNGNVSLEDVVLVNGTTSNVDDPVCSCCTNGSGGGTGGGSGGGSAGTGGGSGGSAGSGGGSGGDDGGDDSSPLPLLTVSGVDAAEGTGTDGSVDFILTLSQPAVGDESVQATTVDGTALAGEDYRQAEFNVAFREGETELRVPVTIIGDATDEEDENFTLLLFDPENLELERISALGVIRDDDDAPATGGGGTGGGQTGGGGTDGGNPGGGGGGDDGGTASGSLVFITTNDWGNGFQAAAEFTNNGPALDGWTLTFEVPYEITQMWNAKIISRQGNTYTVENEHWNARVPSGGKVQFGFLGRPGGNTPEPKNVTLNGQPLR
ncbi:MAG: lytic polysaccharide monooxygenase [Verrucomicrobiota bacterium]